MQAKRCVSELVIYPVKSMGGVQIHSVEVLPKGLAMDRRWMLIDTQQRFITQRTLTQLCHFHVHWSVAQDFFEIEHKGERIQVPVAIPKGSPQQAQVWDDAIEVIEVDAALSRWCSRQLGMACRLVAFPEPNPRPVDPDFALSGSDVTSLSDGYPILVIGQASLDDLNTRLPQPVGMERFRPNIVVANGRPYEEDHYRDFSIGSVAMAGVKPCARCVMTTIDPATGHKGKEPLQTLRTYRKLGGKILFGQNVIPVQTGIITVGDQVFLQPNALA